MGPCKKVLVLSLLVSFSGLAVNRSSADELKDFRVTSSCWTKDVSMLYFNTIAFPQEVLAGENYSVFIKKTNLILQTKENTFVLGKIASTTSCNDKGDRTSVVELNPNLKFDTKSQWDGTCTKEKALMTWGRGTDIFVKVSAPDNTPQALISTHTVLRDNQHPCN